LLLPDHAGEIETTSVFDTTSTRAARGLLKSDSNRSEEATQSESLSNLEEDLDRLPKFGDEGATACWGPPVFDNYSYSNEKFSLTSTIPSSSSLGGPRDKGATAFWETPVLDNHSQPNDHLESFSGSHLGLNITSMPQGRFVYWKGLEPSVLLKYDSRLAAFT
jgi:hypothetical protein